MLKMLEDYENYILQLQSKIKNQDNYYSKFSDSAILAQQILKQEEQIRVIIQNLKSKQKFSKEIRDIRRNLIPDHYNFKKIEIKQKWTDKVNNVSWQKQLKINHKLRIQFKIKEIQPITKHHNLNQHQQQINFDQLCFHLHHINEENVSSMMKYCPSWNLYNEDDVIDRKMMKGQRFVSLSIEHVVRPSNILFFQHFLTTMPIKIVAESSYGLVLGIADFYLEEADIKNKVKNKFKCVIFHNRCEDMNHQGYQEFQSTLVAKIQFSFDLYPIGPLIEQLQKNSIIHEKKRKTSKSKSPNKLISIVPTQGRSSSPKRKRQYMADIIKPSQTLIELTVFQTRQYKHKLDKFNLQKGKQITYKQIQNIKQKRIQLIKVNNNYFLKIYLERQTNKQKGTIMFAFNQCEYCIYVVQNNIFEVLLYEDYHKNLRRDIQKHKTYIKNKLVYLTSNKSVYVKQNNKIMKNSIKQILINGMLTQIFIKTPFQQCQIFTHLPFIITDIVHQEYGYLIYFYYEKNQYFVHEMEEKMMIFLKSKFKDIIEIHVFDCQVQPRIESSQTIYKEITVNKSELFYSLSLRFLANQNFVYNIRSSSALINIVNGKCFKYQSQTNENLIIQILFPIEDTLITDIIFYDNKYRCFFMKLVLIHYQEPQQEAIP